jgi:uncharacterized RDD family membrane protein YckC
LTWYTWQNGIQQGPFEEQQVKEWATAGLLAVGTLVWREGAAGWQPVAEAFAHGEPEGPRRRCERCGTMYPESWIARWGGADVCAYCKPRHVAELREGSAVLLGQGEFAGFGVRFVARMIDGVILSVVNMALQIPMFVLAAGASQGGKPEEMGATFLWVYGLTVLGQLGVQCGYEVWFVTKKGGTPGKLMLQLQVLDGEGNRLRRGQSFGRYFAQFLTGFTLGLGYLLPLWDSEKRALHDMVADTRVMKK